jgi:predicted DCC family thiol-disulfide oxidoreductase YuxK
MQINTQDVWLVYDGDCPICRPSANALKIREAVGKLHLINAREPHPILEEIQQAGLDLDEGMVVKFKNTLYHGADAQHILAMIGTNHGWINRINVLLFRSACLAKIFYPIMRTARNALLHYKGIPKINHPGGKP